MPLFLFKLDELDARQQKIVERITSFIVSVYASAYFRIHFKPRAPDGLGNMIYIRDLILNHKNIDEYIFLLNKKCFQTHATAWLNPTNVALSTHSANAPFTVNDLCNPEQALPKTIATK